MRFGTDDNDDFDLTSIEPSSSLPVCAGRMLHATVAFNRIGNARTLLAAGAEPEQYWRGQTPLFTSASVGNVSMVRLLHEHNASLDHPAVTSLKRGHTSSHTATCSCCPGPHQCGAVHAGQQSGYRTTAREPPPSTLLVVARATAV